MNIRDWTLNLALFLIAAAPGIAIYIAGSRRWGWDWLWLRVSKSLKRRTS